MKSFLIILLLLIVAVFAGLVLKPEHDLSQKFFGYLNISVSKNIEISQEVDLTDCISYFDGCNTCMVEDGVIGGCTKMFCEIFSEPYCIEKISVNDDLDIENERSTFESILESNISDKQKEIEYFVLRYPSGNLDFKNNNCNFYKNNGGILEKATTDELLQYINSTGYHVVQTDDVYKVYDLTLDFSINVSKYIHDLSYQKNLKQEIHYSFEDVYLAYSFELKNLEKELRFKSSYQFFCDEPYENYIGATDGLWFDNYIPEYQKLYNLLKNNIGLSNIEIISYLSDTLSSQANYINVGQYKQGIIGISFSDNLSSNIFYYFIDGDKIYLLWKNIFESYIGFGLDDYYNGWLVGVEIKEDGKYPRIINIGEGNIYGNFEKENIDKVKAYISNLLTGKAKSNYFNKILSNFKSTIENLYN